MLLFSILLPEGHLAEILQHTLSQEGKCSGDRRLTHLGTFAGKLVFFHSDFSLDTAGDIYQSDRLFLRSPIRPGDTGHCDRNVRLRGRRRSPDHLLRHIFADSAILLQRRLFHAEQPALCFVGVSDIAALIGLGDTGDIDDPAGKQTPRSGFRTGQRELICLQEIHDRLLQRHVLLRRIDTIAETVF